MSDDMESKFATMQVMRSQELDVYNLPVNLCHLQQYHQGTVDECRYKMLEWCFKVADYCQYSRETVAVASSYIDRYLLVHPIINNDRRLFQLLCMTALYTAVKIYEAEALSPALMASLSKECYSANDIVEMEMKILCAMKWFMHPPTPHSFVRLFLDLLGDTDDMMARGISREKIIEMTNEQIDFAILTTTMPASTVAFAAIANTFQGCQVALRMLFTLCAATNIDVALLSHAKDHLLWCLNGDEPASSLIVSHCGAVATKSSTHTASSNSTKGGDGMENHESPRSADAVI